MGNLYDHLPNFFILGAAKAGTTSLYVYLRQHPDIYLPSMKEPHFFDDDIAYGHGLEWYAQNFFSQADRYMLRGDATPFMHLPHIVCSRIKDSFGIYAPKLKFIVILRNPVKRAWSHYLHRKRNFVEPYTFSAALERENTRLKNDPNAWVGYFHDGLYAQQLEIWLRFFEKEQFLFLLHDDLETKPHKVIRQVFSFLDVNTKVSIDMDFRSNVASVPKSKSLMKLLAHPPKIIQLSAKLVLPLSTRRKIRYILKQANVKVSTNKPEMDKSIATCLKDKYASDIKRTSSIIGRDLSGWLKSNEV